MIHFDFDDRYQDEHVVGSAISKREGVLLSTVFHALLVGLILFGPEWSFLRPDPAELEARQQELERSSASRSARRAASSSSSRGSTSRRRKPPPRAELSDIDRQAQRQ